MRINAKLAQWRAAGVIDEPTLRRISEYEKEHDRPQGLFYVTGLGAISIALGIVALVASNWQAISPSVKIVGLFSLCLLTSALILKQHRQGKASAWVNDILILIYSGLVIAGIGLIGQIFQLHGATSGPLLTWALAIGPLVFFSRGYVVPLHWTLLLLAGGTFWVMEIFRGNDFVVFVYLAAIILLPLLFIALANVPTLKQRLPHFSKAFGGLGWSLLFLDPGHLEL